MVLKRLTSLSIGLIICIWLVNLSWAIDEALVTTKYGDIQGFVNDTYRAFLGVPYAAPPVGSLRWKPPQSVTPWKPSTLQATTYAPGCPQVCVLPPYTCPEKMDEDCLYLNIYTPRLSAIKEPLPVVVYLHGGNFRQGTISSLLFEGGYIASTGNVIVVVGAYRLGALGWAVTTNGLQGNYGLMDQRLLLSWIKDNIDAFGGDPKRVTLWGQSAGATSIAAHLVSPNSIGLFERVISESNPLQLPLKPIEDAVLIGDEWAKQLGCAPNNIDCLMSKSAQQIIEAQEKVNEYFNILKPLELFYPWTPTVNGFDIPDQPLYAFMKGKFQKVPTLIGVVTEEAFIYIWLASKQPVSTVGYIGAVGLVFGVEGYKVIGEYPPPLTGDKRPLLSQLGTDYIFGCPTRNASDNFARYGMPGVYVYVFNHSMNFDAWGPRYNFCIGHVCHGGDLPFFFHANKPPVFVMTPEEERMSHQFIQWLTNFVHTGNPNEGPNKPQLAWPAYDMQSRKVMTVTLNSFSQAFPRGDKCNFWDSFGYGHGWGGPNLFEALSLQKRH